MSLWLAEERSYVEDEPDCIDDEPPAVESCPVCGAQGACSYDVEGRPLIHTDTELPEDEVPACPPDSMSAPRAACTRSMARTCPA